MPISRTAADEVLESETYQPPARRERKPDQHKPACSLGRRGPDHDRRAGHGAPIINPLPPHRAGLGEGAGEEGAVGEAEFAPGLEAARFAAGIDVGVAAALIGPFAPDLQGA
jgi:hypothetical protein